MNIIEKIKQLFTKKEQVDKENIRKFVVYYCNKSFKIGDTEYFSYDYPDLITILLQCGFVPSVGEAYRLLNMGQISACVVGSINPKKIPFDYYEKTSYWIDDIKGRESIKKILDKGIILYKGTIPVYIEFRKANNLEEYVNQLEPFKKYLKGEMGNRSEYSVYPLEIYDEAIRQIRTND